jgi:uncharacterized RDD family membrane protein YckC
MICPFCLKDAPAGFPQCPNCQAPVDRSVTPPYSGVFRRIMALFFDILIPSVLAGLYFGLNLLLGSDLQMILSLVFAGIILLFTLLQLILLFGTGQTIGKKLMGIKIIRVDCEKAGFGTLFMREIVGRMVCGLTLNIGYLMILFNPERRGLHDKIAGTIVVRKLHAQAAAGAGPEPVPAPVFQPVAAPPLPPESLPSPVAAVPPPPLPASAPSVPPPPLAPPEPLRPTPAPAEAASGTCPACQSPIEDAASKFCLVCGFPIQSGVKAYTRFCPNCKSPVAEDASACQTCGRSMPQESAPVLPAPSDTSAAAEATVVVAAPQLISYTADGAQEVFNLALPLTKIGRLKDNHIAMSNEKAVSGHHCEIYMEGNQFMIRDLGSTNGVYINNRKVDNSPLVDGDKIKLGFKIFRFKQS